MTTWSSINTAQTPDWQSISTGVSSAYEFNPFATHAFAESCFADGSTGDIWGLIATDQAPNWTQIST